MKIKLAIFLLLISSIHSVYAARCSDFSTQREAQEYMNRTGDTRLDGDKDGEACECLPGGSAYGKSICRKYR